jgi:predicted  nucleic acid-binding Zn ribbon protein
MFAARISFPISGPDTEQAMDRAQELLGTWYKNGQILSDSFVLARMGAILDAFVTVPERGALDDAHNNTYAKRAIAELGAAAPAVAILGEDPTVPSCCSCASRSALVLYTHYLTELPPVRCLDCFDPVPLYRLPHIRDQEHLGILHWASDYRACDTLQMGCTTGERFGEHQLFRHDSSLNREGRDLCRDLEEATGVPVFYYLHKSRGRSLAAEEARRCPSCGSEWRLAAQLHKLFDFRCDACRLLSTIAACLADEAGSRAPRDAPLRHGLSTPDK